MTLVTALIPPAFDRGEEWLALLVDYAGSTLDGSGFWGDHQPTSTPSGYRDWVSFLAIRHRLNDFLLELGGHIGYSVRPSRRREGHAGAALALAVREARDHLDLRHVLVTCDEDNVASLRTIESTGGILEDTRQGKRRYWITT